MVMDASGASTATGGKIIQWPAHGGTNQQWRLTKISDNVFTMVNVNSGLCLDVPDQSTTNGIQLQQWTCSGAAGHGDKVERSADGDRSRESVDALVALLEQDLDA